MNVQKLKKINVLQIYQKSKCACNSRELCLSILFAFETDSTFELICFTNIYFPLKLKKWFLNWISKVVNKHLIVNLTYNRATFDAML